MYWLIRPTAHKWEQSISRKENSTGKLKYLDWKIFHCCFACHKLHNALRQNHVLDLRNTIIPVQLWNSCLHGFSHVYQLSNCGINISFILRFLKTDHKWKRNKVLKILKVTNETCKANITLPITSKFLVFVCTCLLSTLN